MVRAVPSRLLGKGVVYAELRSQHSAQDVQELQRNNLGCCEET